MRTEAGVLGVFNKKTGDMLIDKRKRIQEKCFAVRSKQIGIPTGDSFFVPKLIYLNKHVTQLSHPILLKCSLCVAHKTRKEGTLVPMAYFASKNAVWRTIRASAH